MNLFKKMTTIKDNILLAEGMHFERYIKHEIFQIKVVSLYNH